MDARTQLLLMLPDSLKKKKMSSKFSILDFKRGICVTNGKNIFSLGTAELKKFKVSSGQPPVLLNYQVN